MSMSPISRHCMVSQSLSLSLSLSHTHTHTFFAWARRKTMAANYRDLHIIRTRVSANENLFLSFFLSFFLFFLFFLATCLHPWTCVGGIQTNAKIVFLLLFVCLFVCLSIYFFPSFICVQVRNYFATPANSACGHTGVWRPFQTKK